MTLEEENVNEHEHEHGHHEMFEDEHFHEVDFSSFSKQELVNFLKESLNENDLRKVDHTLKEIKPVYEEKHDREKEEALHRFLEEGGEKTDFEYRNDEYDVAFDTFYKLLRERRNNFFRELEDQKTENLRLKNNLLDQLRKLLDGEDTDQTFNTFKKIQKEWIAIGAVPMLHSKTTWANYHALVDRFYDRRSIYFELKELDRKKNLEQKTELCEKAEGLLNYKNFAEAIKTLNDLHHDYKHIGPVPLTDKDTVWMRFKAASDALYQKRDELMMKQRSEWETNLQAKLKLCGELEPLASFNSDRIKEWNELTHHVQTIQKKWEAVGFVPRSQSKEVNKKFWTSIKAFFSAKSTFFKGIDEMRKKNQALRDALVVAAQELKNSQDWDKATQTMKELQVKWKEIGPSPDRLREKTYKKFKEACDYFFAQKRNAFQQVTDEYDENLKKKEAIIREMEQHIAGRTCSIDLYQKFQEQFGAIGFVPREQMREVGRKWESVIARFLDSIPKLSESDRAKAKFNTQVKGFKNDPDANRKIYSKEAGIRKKMHQVEEEIALLKNNLEFFRHSKNADKLRAEVNKKIADAEQHLHDMKDQLKVLNRAADSL